MGISYQAVSAHAALIKAIQEINMLDRKFRPMHAMNVNWHLTKALEENSFSMVSDKLREQLIEGGMSPREATINAPVMLDGADRTLRGEFDFKRIRQELNAERRSHNAGNMLALPAAC